MNPEEARRRARETVETCHARHHSWPLTGKPYACIECIAAALAQRPREIGRACLEEMNPINYNGRNYEAWVEIIDRHHEEASAARA